MKKQLLIVALALLAGGGNLYAQYCGNSGAAQCTPSGTLTEAGFLNSEEIPCIVRNANTDIVIQFKNFDQFNYSGIDITINSLKYDSIGNLPAGLCWSTNKADNTFNNQEDGCIRITGNTSAISGQYKLRIFVTLNTSIGVIGPNLDVETVNLKAYLRVIQYNSSVCPPVDSSQTSLYEEFPANFDSIAHITGTVYIDRNSNNQLDVQDSRVSNAHISIGGEKAITNGSGVYHFYMPAGTYVLAPEVNNVPYTFSPSSISVNAPTIGTEYGGNNFQVTLPNNYCTGSLAVTSASFPPRPGFSNTLAVILNNELSGNAISTTLRLKYDSIQSFVSSTPAASFVDTVGRIIEWNISALASGNTWYSYVQMYTPQSASLGTIVSNVVSLSNSSCQSLDSLTFVDEEAIVGSYDPNDKAISPLGYGNWNGVNPDKHSDFTYKIRFQNTGTYLAENVVVVDTMSQHLDLSTLKVLSASHPYEVSIGSDRAVKFIFNQIMLPDSNSNEPGSHGYILYSIKPYAGLAQNVEITNRGDIYFDFNAPVLTNTTLTTIDYIDHTVGINEAKDNYSLAIYPNPTNGRVSLNIDERLVGNNIAISDMSGRVLYTTKIEKGYMDINLEDYASGVYMIRTGNTVKKLVKK